jgi:hypothetical protein
MLSVVAIFTLGSGICGGATSGGMLIAGRAIQGIGGGGINTMVDMIVSDLVPLRQRGAFMAIILAVINVGTSLGPFVGGALVQTTTWRWAFYLNLPVGGASMVLLVLFLNVNYKKAPLMDKLKQIDFVGNALLMACCVSILYALTYGGATIAWSSACIITPLVLGILGFGLFALFESSKFCPSPVIPLRLYSNRNSAIAFFLTFIHSILTLWRLYFLPVYFQSVLGSSPTRAGVQLLPTVVVLFPFAVISGGFVLKTGKYLPLHYLGFAVMVIGHGCFTLLDAQSSTATWILLQAITGAGSSIVLTTLLPAVQAGLAEKDVALATGAWSFMRSFGVIWGVAIPSAIFNNRFTQLSGRIADPVTRSVFSNGDAYEHVSAALIRSFPAVTREQIISVYSDSLKRTWQISIAFAGAAFIATFAQKAIKLRKTVDTEHGLKDEKPTESGEVATGVKLPVEAGVTEKASEDKSV